MIRMRSISSPPLDSIRRQQGRVHELRPERAARVTIALRAVVSPRPRVSSLTPLEERVERPLARPARAVARDLSSRRAAPVRPANPAASSPPSPTAGSPPAAIARTLSPPYRDTNPNSAVWPTRPPAPPRAPPRAPAAARAATLLLLDDDDDDDAPRPSAAPNAPAPARSHSRAACAGRDARASRRAPPSGIERRRRRWGRRGRPRRRARRPRARPRRQSSVRGDRRDASSAAADDGSFHLVLRAPSRIGESGTRAMGGARSASPPRTTLPGSLPGSQAASRHRGLATQPPAARMATRPTRPRSCSKPIPRGHQRSRQSRRSPRASPQHRNGRRRRRSSPVLSAVGGAVASAAPVVALPATLSLTSSPRAAAATRTAWISRQAAAASADDTPVRALRRVQRARIAHVTAMTGATAAAVAGAYASPLLSASSGALHRRLRLRTRRKGPGARRVARTASPRRPSSRARARTPTPARATTGSAGTRAAR